MKEIEVFDGNTLHDLPVEYPAGPARCVLCGQDASGERTYVRMDEELLSRHMMLLGGIGTGKTNAFYQIISQLRRGMTDQDVMIVFDTKGDFYQSFYRPGDVVISNDAAARRGRTTGTSSTSWSRARTWRWPSTRSPRRCSPSD